MSSEQKGKSMSHQFLEELVRTQSFSGEERAAAEVCLARMNALGYKYAEIDNVGNVIGANYDYKKDPHADLLLFSHLDTVSGFWPVKRDENGLSGRGVVDAKGCLASYIEAGAFAPDGLKVIVAGVTQEEAPTSVGIIHLLTYIKPKLAVNGEPSNYQGITIAYKGRILLHCISLGSASHAGMNAQNPMEAVVEYLTTLRTRFPRNSKFDSLTFNVTHIDYGNRDSLNSIPARLDFFIDVRIPPSLKLDEIEKVFKSSAPQSIEVKIMESFAGCEISQNHILVRKMISAARAVGIDPKYLRKSGSADMNITIAAGIPTIAYGPGDSKLDHTQQEYLSWNDYEKAILVLREFLKQISLTEVK